LQYCGKECQRSHWKEKHKSECRYLGRLYESAGELYHNAKVIKYAMGYMPEDHYLLIQRAREAEIFEEVRQNGMDQIVEPLAAQPGKIVRMTVESGCAALSSYRHMRLELHSASKPSRRRTPVAGAAGQGDPQKAVSYLTFRVAPFSMVDPGINNMVTCIAAFKGNIALGIGNVSAPPLSEESKMGIIFNCQLLLKKVVDDMLELGNSRHGARVIPDFIFLTTTGPWDVLFWMKFATSTKHITQNIPRRCFWYVMPHPMVVCRDAVFRACEKLFGQQAAIGIFDRGVDCAFSSLLHNDPAKVLFRSRWRETIVYHINNDHISSGVRQSCVDKATERGCAAEVIGEELIEEALRFTDLFRHNLLEYLTDGGSCDTSETTYLRVPLAHYFSITEGQLRGIIAELDAMDLEYPADIQELMALPVPNDQCRSSCECERVMGSEVVLADGHVSRQLTVQLHMHGLIPPQSL